MTSEELETAEMTATVSHGADKHCVHLTSDVTVAELFLILEGLTGVPVSGQKIINRGRTLVNSEQRVKEAGLKHGSRLMLIGKKYNQEDDENYKQIMEVEKKIVVLIKKQDGILEELSGIEKGYMKNLENKALCMLEKRLAHCNEEYIRLLEKLDSLDLGSSNQSIRSKRKTVIKQIQCQLDCIDKASSTIHQLQGTKNS